MNKKNHKGYKPSIPQDLLDLAQLDNQRTEELITYA